MPKRQYTRTNGANKKRLFGAMDAVRKGVWSGVLMFDMVAITTLSADFNHYTWWSLAATAVYSETSSSSSSRIVG